MKKTLALILTFIMVLALVPSVALAADPVAWIGEKGYATLGEAVKDAESGDTITLGEGDYSLYDVCGHTGALGSSKDYTAGKDLTFIGKGKETIWQIGADTPIPDNGEYNSDYSFKNSESVTFKNMTLRTGKYGADADYLGFSYTKITNVENCIMLGRTAYWGDTSATFKNTTFNCPKGSYALWTYCSPTMTFDECTFNSSGKVINVYTDYSAGKHDITVNFKNCTVNNEEGTSLKPVLNINDYNMDNYKYILNITGDNKVTGVDVDDITCSRLFGFGGKAETNNKAKTVVYINDVNVWGNGNRIVDHNCTDFKTGSYDNGINVNNTQYTDGYKDNAFTVTPKPNVPGSFDVTCDYCGYTETSTGGLYNDIELERTVKQGQEIEPTNQDTYKVNGPSNITVDYTATMNMEKLRWLVAGKDVDLNTIPGGTVSSPWELLMALASAKRIGSDTEVILTFKFDDDKIDLKAFEKKYEDGQKVLELTSDMFEIADDGVTFGPEKDAMTIKCNWNWNKETDPDHAPDPIITLKGCGLPVTNDWNGSKQIKIENSGCVKGMVHIKKPGSEAAVAMAEIAPNVAANVQAQNTYPPVDNTIKIPIVGGRADDNFTLYYGGGSSDDSSGGSSSGGGYYNPTTTPVPVIVIPPKTGDMTVWQSILHFLGIR